jgi:hypothetical protein
MKGRNQKSEARGQNRAVRWFGLLALLGSGLVALATDVVLPCPDRAAIERVYYNHRLGEKPPFEQVLPPATLENLVRQDLRKEAALKKTYGVEVTPALLDAEVRRINTTTRAPEILAEIKVALGNDPARFANVFAKPILVERLLREKFDNDDALHAAQRREAEHARANLLAKKPVEGMQNVTWHLTPRLADKESGIKGPGSGVTTPPPQTHGAAKSGAYSVEATAQLAQPLTPPPGERDGKLYFEDLDPELQQVLRVQLNKPGTVSAVLETPRGFLVFLAKEQSAEALSAASLSIPKRSFEEWLAQQPEP